MSDVIPTLETIRLSLADKVATVTLNRPEKANAMNWAMWQDIRSAMQWADRTPGVRAVVLQGAHVGHHADVDFLDREIGIGRAVAHVGAAHQVHATTDAS